MVPYIPSTWKIICGLVFDEMTIKEQIDFDTSTGAYIRNVTIQINTGNTNKLVCKVLLFQMFGVSFHIGSSM